MLRQSEGVRWEDKIELAMHTGNVGSVHRKSLAAVAEKSPREVFVNELFIGDHGEMPPRHRRDTRYSLSIHSRDAGEMRLFVSATTAR